MSEQLSIPVPETEPERQPCAWCGAPSHGEPYEVEREQWGFQTQRDERGNEHRRKILKRAAIRVPACNPCKQRLDAQRAD